MKKLSAVFVLLLFLSACREFKAEKGADSITRIMLLSIRANNAAVLDEDRVPYPDLHFGGEVFRSAFISNFNSFSNSLQIVSAPELPSAKAAVVRLRSNGFLPMKLNYDEKTLTSAQISELLTLSSADAYAVMHLTFSIWKQNAEGKVIVYSKSGQVLWTQKMDAVSTYIIKDPASPYLSDYDFADENIEQKKSHAAELNIVFTEMGQAAAAAMDNIWKKIRPPAGEAGK